MVKQRGLGHSN